MSNSSPVIVKRALDQAERIIEMIEEDLPEGKYLQAQDFFDDILEQVRDVHGKIDRFREVSKGRQRALDNWEEAVAKWLPG
jgi:uncharacterized protein YbjQ (UPF0145 family)